MNNRKNSITHKADDRQDKGDDEEDEYKQYVHIVN